MNKLTAEKCCQLLDSLNSNGMSILEGYYCEALEIALPILEQQERGCVRCGGNGSVEIDHGEMGIEHMTCNKCTALPDQSDNLKHVGYLFFNAGGGVVYSPSGFGMRGFTCAGKIYADTSLQPEQATNQNGEQ